MNTQKLIKLTTATRGRRVVPMAIVAFCMAAALPLWAAQRNWKGNGANTYWNTSGNWDTQPGGSDSLQFRTSGVKNMTATLNGSYTYTGNIHMGAGSSASNPYIFEATDPANTLTIKDDTWLGYHENGWLWIKSGKYVFNGTGGKNFHMGEGGEWREAQFLVAGRRRIVNRVRAGKKRVYSRRKYACCGCGDAQLHRKSLFYRDRLDGMYQRDDVGFGLLSARTIFGDLFQFHVDGFA